MKKYDVIVIGAGHAGVEAATAAARRGAKVALFTLRESDVGAMSCNPSIGGVGKSQLLAELDALGGVMPAAADISGIQYRILNATHGAATQALRAQIDRNMYHNNVMDILKSYKNLDLLVEPVKSLDLDEKTINDGYQATAIVFTTGTFLNGLTHMGSEKHHSGRIMDSGEYQENDVSISPVLKAAGFELIRLKTGTPARLIKDSIDYSKLDEQPLDDLSEFVRFSFCSAKPRNPSILTCFVSHTVDETHQVIRDNIKNAPMYSGEIVGIGPRYCPSIEDKVMRFPEHKSHHVFLEPEAVDSDLIYPNGISTSFGAEVQDKWIRTIPGLENVQIARYGYAIEYDAIDARQISATLMAKHRSGLFFAGQINGTSGYEEAAAQGVIAGANAAAFSLKLSELILDRTNSFIGVLIDDITTMGIDEPYRMFTSRSEYRLSIRVDNAVQRLGSLAEELGLLTAGQKAALVQNMPGILERSAEIDKIYAGYIGRQVKDMEQLKNDINIKIPKDFDYSELSGLTLELRQKLAKVRPENMHQLGRIQGVTPAGKMVVLNRVRDRKTHYMHE